MDNKFLLKSLTIWGAIITLAGVVGVRIPVMQEEGEQIINAVFEVIGLVSVVIGRLRATKPLGFSLK